MSTISEAVSGASWSMRSRETYTIELIVSRYPIRASGGRDMVLWKHSEDVYKDQFSATRRWECIRASNPKVHWYRLVWFATRYFASCFHSVVVTSRQTVNRLSNEKLGNYAELCFFVGGGGGGGRGQ
ncbi:unnamed protein product [Brassica oleracea]